jgi:hypothetical protein
MGAPRAARALALAMGKLNRSSPKEPPNAVRAQGLEKALAQKAQNAAKAQAYKLTRQIVSLKKQKKQYLVY